MGRRRSGLVPVYDSQGIVLYHGNCYDIIPQLGPVATVLTDPPYNAKTHKGARAGNRRTERDTNRPLDLTFDSIGDVDMARLFELCAQVASRWFVATMAYQHVVALETNPPPGWDFVRFGIWRKPDSTPQFTGDRPGMGWEAVAVLHRPGRKRWNGGGHHAFWQHPIDKSGLHPAGKPLSLLKEWVTQFTDPEETILDPFAGSGTTLLAARRFGRKAIGIEADDSYVQLTVQRLEATHKLKARSRTMVDDGLLERGYSTLA